MSKQERWREWLDDGLDWDTHPQGVSALVHQKMERKSVLDRLISDKTLRGEFWGKGGVLELEKERGKCVFLLAHSGAQSPTEYVANYLCAASSTYFAAAGNAWAKARTTWNIFARPVWFLRAIVLFTRAETWSDEAVLMVGGIENLTPAQLDVRSSIKRRGYRNSEAWDCLDEAFKRTLEPHTRGLLLVTKAEMLASGENFNRAWGCFREAYELVPQIEPKDAVRVLKAYANFLRKPSKKLSEEIFAEALSLAQKHGLLDQVEKIRALQSQ